MAWIQVEQSLFTHRKTVRLASLLHVDHETAAMRMIRLWTWALDNAPGGDLSELTPDVIAFGASWQGEAEPFVEALEQSGFADRDGATFTLHHWWQYAGKLIEKRRANAARMREARGTHNTITSHEQEHTYKERATHVQRTCNARAGATEEESREESSTGENSTGSGKEIGGGGNNNHAREALADSAAAVSVELGINDQEKGAAGALRQIVTLSKDHPAENLVALAVDCRNHFQDEGWETWSLGRRMYKFSKWVSRESVLRNEDLAKHPARASPNGVPESIHFYEPTADDLARIELAAKTETTRRGQRRE